MSTTLGATVPVAFGAVSLAVAGTFVFPYQIVPSPNWITDASIGQKTTTGFVVTFSDPAPADATLDYTVEER